MTRNFALLLHGYQRAIIRATGQFLRENIELVVVVNGEVENLRRFHKKQTEKTRAVAAKEWDRTVLAFNREHGEDTDLPNPFKASE